MELGPFDRGEPKRYKRHGGKKIEVRASYNCDIKLIHKTNEINAKLLMSLMTFEAKPRDIIKLRCNGEDEVVACKVIVDTIIGRLGDELCPDFEDFRNSYATSCGLRPKQYRRLKNLKLLKAYASALKERKVCIGKKKQKGKTL